jgi:hypothetical protein
VSTKAALLGDEERTLSILRYIGQGISLQTRWYPVFQRYLQQVAGRVAGMGGDPAQVPPTPDGDWQHPGRCEHHRHDRDGERATVAGKIVALHYDHFGDFEGFVVQDDHDEQVAVASSEERVEALAHRAWRERLRVTARRLPDGGLADLALSGHPDDD